jgi:hypothetical protein
VPLIPEQTVPLSFAEKSKESVNLGFQSEQQA